MGFTTCDLLNARLISITSFSSSSASRIVVLVMSPISAIAILLETCMEDAPPGVGLDIDTALHARQPLLDDGEADASARIALRGMQPLEYVEYAVLVLRRDADAVVADAEVDRPASGHRPDTHLGPRPRRHELERVAYQV